MMAATPLQRCYVRLAAPSFVAGAKEIMVVTACSPCVMRRIDVMHPGYPC